MRAARFTTTLEAARLAEEGERIKVRMIKLRMTMKELSRTFDGVAGYQRVGRIIRGETIASKKERALFAKALKCAQKDLFIDGKEEEGKSE